MEWLDKELVDLSGMRNHYNSDGLCGFSCQLVASGTLATICTESIHHHHIIRFLLILYFFNNCRIGSQLSFCSRYDHANTHTHTHLHNAYLFEREFGLQS